MKPRHEWVIAPRFGSAFHLKRWSDLGPGEAFQESTSLAAFGVMDALSHHESTAREIYADITGLSAHRVPRLDEDAWAAIRQAIERGRYVVASGRSHPSVAAATATGFHLFTNSPQERNTHNYPVKLAELLALTRSKWREIGETGARTLAAQWAQETTNGTNCWNYNIGNIKAASAAPLHMYLRGVWEVLSEGDVQATIIVARGLARLATEDECKTKKWSHKVGEAVVVFDPPHVAARFLAFDSLSDGVQYWTDLHKRYGREHAQHVPALKVGDTATVAHVLKVERYYSGVEADYARNMKEKKAAIDKLLRAS
jgi:hypothetical protein